MHDWYRSLPIALTWTRLALVPIFVLVFYLPFWWTPPASALLFALAGITDWVDGYLARRWQVVSKFGAFLDPVADKIMVGVALVLLVQHDNSVWLALPAAVIIGREITISALREWMAQEGVGSRVAVSFLGKLKTAFQIIAISMLLFRYDIWIIPVYELGKLLLLFAAGLTLWSMFGYLQAARQAFRE